MMTSHNNKIVSKLKYSLYPLILTLIATIMISCGTDLLPNERSSGNKPKPRSTRCQITNQCLSNLFSQKTLSPKDAFKTGLDANNCETNLKTINEALCLIKETSDEVN